DIPRRLRDLDPFSAPNAAPSIHHSSKVYRSPTSRHASKILDRNNPERTHHAVVLGDGHVFAGNKMVPVEFEPRLIVIATLVVVIERPAATSSMHKVA